MENKRITVKEYKDLLTSYNLVSNVNKLKREDLIRTLNAVKNYKESIGKSDYKNFDFAGKTVTLNDEQHNIVVAEKQQHMRIIACAGAGKSSTIICRIKYLIDNGIPADQIMLITFNVDAAESMKNKIIDLFGFMPRLTAGTIDSVACRFYHKYFRKDYDVGVSEYVTNLLQYLKSPGKSNILNQYKYLFLDEGQDVNESSFEIIRCFYNAGVYITVIGDDSQTIYSFRGSDVGYILNLDQYFQNINTYKMVHNYRSTPEIITLANKSIEFNTEQIPKTMIPTKPSINFLPQVKHFDGLFQQNHNVVDSLIKLHELGVDFEDMAVLCRRNYPLKHLEELLEKTCKDNQNCIKYVALINDDASDIKPKIKKDHITITSIHKAKGLEWKVVFLIEADDDKFPSDTDQLSIQEERRLFYVAVTRAKEQLYIYFCGKRLTRFVQELDVSLYNFVNFDKKYYSYTDDRSLKWVTGVMDTIKLLNEKDIWELREKNILPKTNPVIKKIHEKYSLNNFISTYYLQADYGEFIDRFISRSIGKLRETTGGLKDISTIIILLATQLTNEELTLFKKYENNFRLNMKKMNTSTSSNEYIEILQEQHIENVEIAVKHIDYSDKQLVQCIANKLLITSMKFNIDLDLLASSFSIKNEIPKKIKEQLLESYERYKNSMFSTNDIKHDIYMISLCNTFLGGRRRLMYRDVYNHFIEGYDQLFNDINNYVTSLISGSNNIVCKKIIRNDQYDLTGEIDLLDLTNNKIVDFKCSGSNKMKSEWIIQLLAYYSMIKKYNEINQNKIDIKFLEVYNPLQGEIYTIDISNWNKEDEFLQYLYKIRIRNISRNHPEYIEQNQEKFPIIYNNIDKYAYITKSINSMKISEYDLKKLFGNNYKFFLDRIKSRKITSPITKPNNNDIIDKISRLSNRKFMVIDTETTGFPKCPSYGVYYPYTELDKYTSSRIVQISWQIYDGNKLIETKNFLIKPKKFFIKNSNIHGITQKRAETEGVDIGIAFNALLKSSNDVRYLVGHNVKFDFNIILSELFRSNFIRTLEIFKELELMCTMNLAMTLKIGGKAKPQKLVKLYEYFFGKQFENQHNALYDVIATADIFRTMLNKRLINLN